MKVNINLKNCYGIQSLKKELDFSKKNIFSIYASNGTMKTSFAKTFMDLSQGKESRDEIYPNRKTIREIKKNGSNLEQNDVFVIKPYDQDYKSVNISALMVNPKLKKQFDEENTETEKEKDGFLELIENLSGLQPGSIEIETCNVFFQGEKLDFFKLLLSVEKEVLNNEEAVYQSIKYDELFNDKTNTAIKNKDFLKNIDNYVKIYNELLEKSTFFKKGIFNHTQASDIATQLEKHGFFKAEHSVVLKGQNEQIKTKNDLELIITEEKNKILENEELDKQFEKIDKILKKNVGLKSFREYLSDNPQIVTELSNPDSLKSKLWISYFKQNKGSFKTLISKYEKSKKTIAQIKLAAENEECTWHTVIDIFIKKFSVPFSLQVGNYTEVLLNEKLPQIRFKFDDVDVEKEKLLEVLSQGEKRALYILNILFEIEIRKIQESYCLLIIDDIADSFDYKNKYAIIECLKEISEIEGFYLIILTHNFDFHRSVGSRLNMKRENKLIAVNLQNDTNLEQEKYQNSPLNHWRDHLEEPVMMLACIPMVRNLFEYSGKKIQFKGMTSFVHMKDETKNLTIEKLKEFYGQCFDKNITKNIKYLDKNFCDFLFKTCDEVGGQEKLENKIILSIAIRLKAEDFMISKINDSEFIGRIKGNQTFKLFDKYKNEFPDNINMKILDRVNLMTPGNIHLNSFMYEPILDMSSDELKKLYDDIKNINNT